MTPAPEPAADEPALRDWLAGRPVLFAYGLLGDVSAKLRPLGFDYMWAQQDWLRTMGAAPQVVRVPTAAPVAANAMLLRDALRDAPPGPPALLVAHSKGGLEGLAALLDDAAAARCSGFVAFQSPFHGTPVADWVAKHQAMQGAARAALGLLGCGDGAGLEDLTTAARRAWIAANRAAIEALAARLPVVSAGTVLDPAQVRVGRDLAYAALVAQLARAAGPNDGLVPLASTRLPGPVRHLEGKGGHVAFVSSGAGRDPVAALRRALGAVLAPSPAPA